ncbi:MAG: hypothetical protein K8I60_19770, partial [Anaerolineae bacterium]|nr:hypothetical protein [Anaerolineae bacterium]
MIRAIRERFFSVRYPYSNMIELQQARVLLSFTWFAVAGVIFWTIFIVLPALTTNARPVSPEDLIILAGPPVLYFIFRYVQRGQLNRAAWIMVILLLAGSVETARDGVGGTKIVLYIAPIVVAGLLLQRRGILTVFVMIGIIMAAGIVIQSQSTTAIRVTPAAELGNDFAYAVTGVTGISLLLFAFSGMAERITLEQATVLAQMDKISTLFNGIALDTDERTVLNQVVTLIHEHFALGAARIYLTDMVGNLVISSGGEFGQPELSSDEVISLTDTNIISEAARMQQIRTIMRRERLDVRSHRMRPNSNIAIALPIMTEDNRVLGV